MGTEINTIIENLCNKFGVTAEYLIPKVVQYCETMSIVGICTMILMIIFSAVGIRFFYRIGVKYSDDNKALLYEWHDYFPSLTGVVFFSIMLVVGIIALSCNIYDLASILAAPEIGAIRYIIDFIK